MPTQPPTNQFEINDIPPVGRTDITVASLAFLPLGREALFKIASEASVSVRLKDIRTAYNNRPGRPIALLFTTQELESHIKY